MSIRQWRARSHRTSRNCQPFFHGFRPAMILIDRHRTFPQKSRVYVRFNRLCIMKRRSVISRCEISRPRCTNKNLFHYSSRANIHSNWVIEGYDIFGIKFHNRDDIDVESSIARGRGTNRASVADRVGFAIIFV